MIKETIFRFKYFLHNSWRTGIVLIAIPTLLHICLSVFYFLTWDLEAWPEVARATMTAAAFVSSMLLICHISYHASNVREMTIEEIMDDVGYCKAREKLAELQDLPSTKYSQTPLEIILDETEV